MGIRFRAAGVAIGLLLAVTVQPAKADSWHVTGQTDFAYCAIVVSTPGWCSNISYSLDLTTLPPVLDTQQPTQPVYLFISNISGQINGTSVFCTTPMRFGCGDLIASQINYSGPPKPDEYINLFASGSTQVSLFGYPSPDPVRINIGDGVAFATWNIVSTPEPSTLMLLGMALLGLMGLTLLKNRLI